VARSIHVHTFFRPSGFRTVAEGIYSALKSAGFSVTLTLGDIVGLRSLWVAGVAQSSDVIVPVWHFGRVMADLLAECPNDVVAYVFVEGDPIVVTDPRKRGGRKLVALAPNQYVAERVSRWFEEVHVVLPPIPRKAFTVDQRLVESIRYACRGYDAVLSYVANSVPRKGWSNLSKVIEALYENEGIRPCFVAVTDADIREEVSRSHRVVRLSLGTGCGDEVIASAVAASDVYASLSYNEGFGVPIAIALLLGKTVASVDAPSIIQSFGWAPLYTCRHTKVEKREWLGEEVQELYIYDPQDLAKAIALAVDASRSRDRQEIRAEAYRRLVIEARNEIVRKMRFFAS